MKRALKLIASILVTLLFSWWAFRDTDWTGMWSSLRTANYLWLLPYFAVLTGIHLCRTLRWGCLLSGIERVSFRKLNEASSIGFMMLLILPFRLGEFARPYLIAQRSSIRKSAAMTSVVLERIVDGLVVATFLWVLLFFVPSGTPKLAELRVASTVMFAVFSGGLLFLLFALWQRQRAVSIVRATAGRISPRLADKAAEIVDAFVGAMRQLPGPGRIVAFFLYTAGYWGLNGFGMALLTRAFDCSGAVESCIPLSLGLFEGYVVLGVLVVGVMIPAAPGMVGTFQAFVKLGLSLFVPAAVVNSNGLAYANVLWLAQTVQQVGFGLLFLSLGQVSFSKVAQDLSQEAENAEAAPTEPVPSQTGSGGQGMRRSVSFPG